MKLVTSIHFPSSSLHTVDRQALRCLPTETRDGRMRIIDEDNEDPLNDLKEAIKRRRGDTDGGDDDVDDDDADEDIDDEDMDDDDTSM